MGCEGQSVILNEHFKYCWCMNYKMGYAALEKIEIWVHALSSGGVRIFISSVIWKTSWLLKNTYRRLSLFTSKTRDRFLGKTVFAEFGKGNEWHGLLILLLTMSFTPSRTFGRIQGRGKSTRQKYWRLELLLVPCTGFTLVHFKARTRIVLGMGVCVFGSGIARPHRKNKEQVKSYDSLIVSRSSKEQLIKH